MHGIGFDGGLLAGSKRLPTQAINEAAIRLSSQLSQRQRQPIRGDVVDGVEGVVAVYRALQDHQVGSI